MLKDENMKKSSTGQSSSRLMSASAAARIQGATAKENGGGVAKESFAARAQKAAALYKSSGKK